MMESFLRKFLFFISLSLLVYCTAAVRDENVAELFVAAETSVWRMNLDGSNKTLFAQALNATSLDFHNAYRLVFWSDVEAHKIYSKDMFNDSAEAKVVIDGGNEWEPRAIAIDYIRDMIYVVDQAGHKIDVFTLDGSKKVEGLVKNMTEPDQGNWTDSQGPSTLDIAVDPFQALVFYGEYNKVIRATMDFSNTKYVGHKSFVSGITVNPYNKEFFYADTERLLFKTNYEGVHLDHVNAYDHPTDYLRGEAVSPRSLSQYDGAYYYLDWRNDIAPGVHKLQYYYKQAVDGAMKNAWTVRVRHPSLQKITDNLTILRGCHDHNCEYICLPSNNMYSNVTHSCFNKDGERIVKS